MKPRRSLNLVAAIGLVLAGFAAWATLSGKSEPKQPLALFGTIPIYWGEAGSIEDTLAGTAEPHWARQALEQAYALRPVDVLDAASLEQHRYLLLAQPRALSPEENVALDNWVRGGGRLLLFADPLLTSHSHFGIGDKRRPQDVALLSPILTRWGLELRFDADQPDELRTVQTAFGPVPVEAAGSLARISDNSCGIAPGALVADCSIGSGSVMIVADATLFEFPDAGPTLLKMAGAAYAGR